MRPIVPTRDLQRRVPTAGRLRMGIQAPDRNGKMRPKSIDTWRLTSENERAIRQAAEMYGGTPQRWDDGPGKQWEVITEASELRVVLPPDPLGGTPCYEKWVRSGCERRCDGVTAVVQVAGPEGPEPAETDCICARNEKMDCQVTTRLSVILLGVDFAGVWRLDTKSWHAAKELPGMVDAIVMVQSSGMPRGLLAIEHREEMGTNKKGQPELHKFVVPSLRIAATPEELASGHASLGLTAGEMRGAALPVGEVDEEPKGDPWDADVIDVEPVVPEPSAPPEPTPLPEPVTAADVRKVAIECNAVAAAQQVPGDEFRHALVHLLTGGRTESSKRLTRDEKNHLLTVLSLFGSDLFAHEEARGEDEDVVAFVDSSGEPVTQIAFEGARPVLSHPAATTPTPGAAPTPVDWAGVAKASGTSLNKLLMRARGVAQEINVEPPRFLEEIAAGSPLETEMLARLEVSA